ncbi:hypothetical protein [Macrococcus sp. DPC7161]|uniref:hypothetical protein n=1 Tax=Macrococcus sp. DPC7161 TaxID=2507060 RepID=UPI00100BE097|nr:hypothetical protein [Macrococcus sp. DPC7161]RXK19068.1 hypothetical protein ER639_01775 [Macrococcus sp. DPC7161]
MFKVDDQVRVVISMDNILEGRVTYVTDEYVFVDGKPYKHDEVIGVPIYKKTFEGSLNKVDDAGLQYKLTPYVIDKGEKTEAQPHLDSNDVVGRFKDVLTEQNIKGVKKYGTVLKDAELSQLELIKHIEEEAIDLWQYIQVLRALVIADELEDE